LDSKQEEAHEKRDRVWRRWLSFCLRAGLEHNPFLIELQHQETEIIIRSFLSLYQVAHWSPAGAIIGQRPRPVVSSTVRDAAEAIWLQRFGVTSNKAPFTSKEAPSYSPPFGPF
jgi:hypothetical protein